MNNIIDTGLVEFELPFDRGTEKIEFNPNDLDFFVRITDMIKSMEHIYDNATDEYEKADTIEAKMEITRNLNDTIRDAFDCAFGNKVSDKIFKYCSPHAIIKSKSQYYPFYFLEWILPEIEKETGKTSKATSSSLEKAMAKHATKYSYKA